MQIRGMLILALPLLGGGCPTSRATLSSAIVDAGRPDMPSAIEAANQVLIASPEPFSSNVTSPLTFEVDVPAAVSHSDVESSISLQTRSGTNIPGKFSWQSRVQYGTPRYEFLATFTPAFPLPRDTDFVVTLNPTGTCSPSQAMYDGASRDANGLWHAVFSTGSNLRVETVRVVSKDMQNALYVYWKMSEVTDVISMQANLQIIADGAVVKGHLETSGPSQEFIYTFDQLVSLSSTAEFRLGPGVKTTTGAAFNPSDWDSPSNVSGTFVVSLNNLTPCLHDGGCWEWHPVVRF